MSDILYGNLPAILPFPVNDSRDFTVLEVDSVFEKIFTHKTYIAKHPQKWLGRVCAAILDTVGGIDIRKQFKESNYENIPPLLMEMPIQNLTYILLCGHVNTYGSQVTGITETCPKCSRPGNFSCDLEKDFVYTVPDSVPSEVSFSVPDGYVKPKDPVHQNNLGFEETPINTFVCDIPRLKHAVRCEKYYSQQELIEFNLRIAQATIRSMSSSALDEETGERLEGTVLDERFVSMLKPNIFLKMRGRDRQAIRRAFRDIDTVNIEIQRECNFCGQDLTIGIDAGDLFPLI